MKTKFRLVHIDTSFPVGMMFYIPNSRWLASLLFRKKGGRLKAVSRVMITTTNAAQH